MKPELKALLQLVKFPLSYDGGFIKDADNKVVCAANTSKAILISEALTKLHNERKRADALDWWVSLSEAEKKSLHKEHWRAGDYTGMTGLMIEIVHGKANLLK
jgi:hypothetical protein